MIAARSGRHTRLRNVAGKKTVERTARLERARMLHEFELKRQGRMATEGIGFDLDHRRSPYVRGNALMSGGNIVLRNHGYVQTQTGGRMPLQLTR